MSPSLLPGSRWFMGVRNPVLRSCLIVGVYLTLIMLGSLVLATRVPVLEPFANYRNAFCAAVFGLAAFLPLWRWRDSAVKLFSCGAIAWGIFSLMYLFRRIARRLWRCHPATGSEVLAPLRCDRYNARTKSVLIWL